MHTIPCKLLLLIALLAMLPACATITPGPDAGVPRVSSPVFGDVTLTGLTVRKERVAGRSTGVTTGSGFSHEQTDIGPYSVHTYGNDSHSTVNTRTDYERYDSDEVLQALRRSIENGRIARRVTRNADVRIEGRRVIGRSTTGVTKVAWDILNCVSLLGLIGTPCLGDVEAEVELRVYYRDEFVGAYRGTGTASWTHPFYGIIPGVPRMRNESINVATGVAARAALRELVQNPPLFPDEPTPEPEHAADQLTPATTR